MKDTTTVPLGAEVMMAPGDVRPGHMMLAPLRTKRIAPLSTCCHGRKNGSVHQNKPLQIEKSVVFTIIVRHQTHSLVYD